MEEIEEKEKKLTDLDSYRLGLKWRAIGDFAWGGLVYTSWMVVGLFVLVTCFTFWRNASSQIPALSGQISTMILVVLIGIIILVINKIKSLNLK